MAEITQEEFKRASEFFGEIWKFAKANYNPESPDNRDYWKKFIDDERVIFEKFCKDDLILAYTLNGLMTGLDLKAKNLHGSVKEYVLKDDILDALNDMGKAVQSNDVANVKAAFKAVLEAWNKSTKIEITTGLLSVINK